MFFFLKSWWLGSLILRPKCSVFFPLYYELHSRYIYQHPTILTKTKKTKHAFNSFLLGRSSIKHPPLVFNLFLRVIKLTKAIQLRSKPASALMAYINLVSSCSLLHHSTKKKKDVQFSFSRVIYSRQMMKCKNQRRWCVMREDKPLIGWELKKVHTSGWCR